MIKQWEALYMDKSMKRKQDLFNLCNGMDKLDIHKKDKCLSFSEAILSIEGMKVSDEVALALEEWKEGKTTYLSIFESILQRYGFNI